MKRIFATALAAVALIAAASIAQMIKPGSTPGGGGTDTNGLVLLETCTASASASCNFTTSISATYDEYWIDFQNIIPATDNVQFWMRMSTNGGSSYDAGAGAYHWNNYRWTFNGAAAGGGDDTEIQISGDAEALDTTVTTVGLSGHVILRGPASTTLWKHVLGQVTFYSNNNTIIGSNSQGWYKSTTAVNAFQFLMSSGNIASGTIRVYGIAK